MKSFDEKITILNDGEKEIDVLVYLKEVAVKNNHTKSKLFTGCWRANNVL